MNLGFFSILFLLLLALKLTGVITLSYLSLLGILFFPLLLAIFLAVIMLIVNIVDKG